MPTRDDYRRWAGDPEAPEDKVCIECGSSDIEEVHGIGGISMMCRDCGHEESENLDY